MRLTALPAFQDNYSWALQAPDGSTMFVDPGQAQPVLDAATQGMRPAAVLLTHHHDDHVGGVAELRARWPDLAVFAPEDERIHLECERVGEGDRVESSGFTFSVLSVPGHTRSHIAFHGHGHLFCGDTLFSLGCGRMFEGTPSQMLASLDRLAALPGPTAVCCGVHEHLDRCYNRKKGQHRCRHNDVPGVGNLINDQCSYNPGKPRRPCQYLVGAAAAPPD